jgi:hypothetical protein
MFWIIINYYYTEIFITGKLQQVYYNNNFQ